MEIPVPPKEDGMEHSDARLDVTSRPERVGSPALALMKARWAAKKKASEKALFRREHSEKIVLGSIHDPQPWGVLAADWLGHRRNPGGVGRQLVADLSHRPFLSAVGHKALKERMVGCNCRVLHSG
jgi:hypothetical protein